MYTKSIGNFMKNVWTDSQGTIHSPSPGSKLWCFNNPVRRLALVSAISAASASTLPRVWLRTIIFNFDDYNTILQEGLREKKGGKKLSAISYQYSACKSCPGCEISRLETIANADR